MKNIIASSVFFALLLVVVVANPNPIHIGLTYDNTAQPSKGQETSLGRGFYDQYYELNNLTGISVTVKVKQSQCLDSYTFWVKPLSYNRGVVKGRGHVSRYNEEQYQWDMDSQFTSQFDMPTDNTRFSPVTVRFSYPCEVLLTPDWVWALAIDIYNSDAEPSLDVVHGKITDGTFNGFSASLVAPKVNADYQIAQGTYSASMFTNKGSPYSTENNEWGDGSKNWRAADADFAFVMNSTAVSGPVCDRETTCSGHGGCDADGLCTCEKGFAGSNCVDIDECAANSSICVAGRKCVNAVGSYTCAAQNYWIQSEHSGLVVSVKSDGTIIMVTKSASDTNQLWNFIPSEGGYLEHVQSKKVVDIKGYNTQPGADIIVWEKVPNALNQMWKYKADAHTFTTKAAPDLVLDVKSASTATNTPVLLWSKKASDNMNQRFVLVEA